MTERFAVSDAVVQVAKTGGQAAATFTYTNAVSMYARMWARSLASSTF